MEVITAMNSNELYYIRVHGQTGFEFVKDMRDATRFGVMCNKYLNEIMDYLGNSFEDYKFRAINVSEYVFGTEYDKNIFDRESFDVDSLI